MKNTYAIIFLFSWLFTFASATHAKPSKALIESFITASENARQPNMKKQDLETYLAFMSDDIIDFHAAFERTFTGKEHFRQGIAKKSRSMVSLTENIDSLILGTDTAVVVVNEDSKYYKKGQLKHFQGRIILVLEFNQQGLISQMRRYLD